MTRVLQLSIGSGQNESSEERRRYTSEGLLLVEAGSLVKNGLKKIREFVWSPDKQWVEFSSITEPCHLPELTNREDLVTGQSRGHETQGLF